MKQPHRLPAKSISFLHAGVYVRTVRTAQKGSPRAEIRKYGTSSCQFGPVTKSKEAAERSSLRQFFDEFAVDMTYKISLQLPSML